MLRPLAHRAWFQRHEFYALFFGRSHIELGKRCLAQKRYTARADNGGDFAQFKRPDIERIQHNQARGGTTAVGKADHDLGLQHLVTRPGAGEHILAEGGLGGPGTCL